MTRCGSGGWWRVAPAVFLLYLCACQSAQSSALRSYGIAAIQQGGVRPPIENGAVTYAGKQWEVWGIASVANEPMKLDCRRGDERVTLWWDGHQLSETKPPASPP